ncbi:MAG: hypothetical protein LC118_00420, partial [Dehalococcoidia bacterium]|nr:hypothetical protein [Dehalococcoidia bacterium]
MTLLDLPEADHSCNVSSRGVILREATKPARKTPPKEPPLGRRLDDGGKNQAPIFVGSWSSSMKGWRFAASRFWEAMLEKELGEDDVALRLSFQKRLEGFKTCGKAVSV